MADWATIAEVGTAAGTLVLAFATFGATRSANRSARIAERAFEARLRPVLVPSRLEDPAEKIMWGDQHWTRLLGGRASVEVGEEVVYLTMSLRNVGSGMAVIHAWWAEPSPGFLSPSRYKATDRKLVLVERPIDAVAFEARHGRQEACYIATGSALDPERKRRLAHVLAEARGVEVVLAYGRDRRGEELAAEVQALAPLSRFERRGPDIAVRWADQMQLEARHARSLGRIGSGRGAGTDRGLG